MVTLDWCSVQGSRPRTVVSSWSVHVCVCASVCACRLPAQTFHCCKLLNWAEGAAHTKSDYIEGDSEGVSSSCILPVYLI